jgi:hypothetical protein
MELNSKTIFINLGAFNELYLDLMISNCLSNAEFPDRIKIGLFLHDSHGLKEDLSAYSKNLKVGYFDYPAALGCCIGREMAHAFYDGEDYYLQLDAHMLFQKNWDTILINKFEKIKLKYPKPVISYYVPWWAVKQNGKFFAYSSDIKTFHNGGMKFDVEDSLRAKYPKPTGDYTKWEEIPEGYIEHHQIAGHFIFSDPSVFDEVRPDTTIMFGPEESLLALRLWTRGYRIFAINEPVVWHLNKGYNNVNPYMRRSAYFKTDELAKHYFDKNHRALKKSRKIFTGEYTGYWGAPNMELLAAYEHAAKLSYKEYFRLLDERYPNDPPESRML